jgi:hypothetical protein
MFRRVLNAADEATGDLARIAQRLAERLELRRCPRVQVTDARIPPLVWSVVGRPRVVLPVALLAELEPAQRDAVIAHELAHVKRRDHRVRWLEVVVLVPFWWNPVAWFARRKLREAEEECCDAWVVWAMPAERRSYGHAMLKTIEFLTDSPGVPALAGSTLGNSFYKRRIEMILKRDINRRMSWASCAMVLLLAAAVLPLAAQTDATPDDPLIQPEPSVSTSSDGSDPVIAEDPGSDGDIVAQLADRDNDEPTADAGDPGATQAQLIARIEKLERALSALLDARGAKQGTRDKFEASSDEDLESPLAGSVAVDDAENELGEELLKLDVLEAQSELESASRLLQRAEESGGGTFTESELDKLRDGVRKREIALKRASIKMQMFQRQTQAQRKQALTSAVKQRALQMRQQAIRAADAQKLQIQNMERLKQAKIQELARMAKLAHMRRDELAKRLEAQQAELAELMARIEQMAIESPESQQTKQLLEEFMKNTLKMSDDEVKAALERVKSAK